MIYTISLKDLRNVFKEACEYENQELFDSEQEKEDFIIEEVKMRRELLDRDIKDAMSICFISKNIIDNKILFSELPILNYKETEDAYKIDTSIYIDSKEITIDKKDVLAFIFKDKNTLYVQPVFTTGLPVYTNYTSEFIDTGIYVNSTPTPVNKIYVNNSIYNDAPIFPSEGELNLQNLSEVINSLQDSSNDN